MPQIIDWTPGGVREAAGFGGGFIAALADAMNQDITQRRQANADLAARQDQADLTFARDAQDRTFTRERDAAQQSFALQRDANDRAFTTQRDLVDRQFTLRRDADALAARQAAAEQDRAFTFQRDQAEQRWREQAPQRESDAENRKRQAALANYRRLMPHRFLNPNDSRELEMYVTAGADPVAVEYGLQQYDGARAAGIIPPGMEPAARAHFLGGGDLQGLSLALQRQAAAGYGPGAGMGMGLGGPVGGIGPRPNWGQQQERANVESIGTALPIDQLYAFIAPVVKWQGNTPTFEPPSQDQIAVMRYLVEEMPPDLRIQRANELLEYADNIYQEDAVDPEMQKKVQDSVRAIAAQMHQTAGEEFEDQTRIDDAIRRLQRRLTPDQFQRIQADPSAWEAAVVAEAAAGGGS